MLHKNATQQSNHLRQLSVPDTLLKEEKLDLRLIELILPNFKNQATQRIIIIKGTNINKLKKQFQLFKKTEFVPKDAEMIVTNEKESKIDLVIRIEEEEKEEEIEQITRAGVEVEKEI